MTARCPVCSVRVGPCLDEHGAAIGQYHAARVRAEASARVGDYAAEAVRLRGCAEREWTMKISKKTREQAAMICAIAASSGDTGYDAAADAIDASADAYDLANAAWSAANRKFHFGDKGRIGDAAAEALLRTGWTP